MTIRHIKRIDEPAPIDIIIPAAGLGKRMKSYGPKPLIKIKNDITILDNQLRLLKKSVPISNIILVCGFQADVLMRNTPSNIIKIENEDYENNNVVRSIGIGLRACMNDVMVVYGDLVFNDYCISAIDFNKSSMLACDNIMDDQEVGCTVNNRGFVENMMYELDKKWGQITFFKGRELGMLKEVCWSPENNNIFGFEAINKIIDKGGKFLYCQHDKAKVIDIDTSKDLERVKEVI